MSRLRGSFVRYLTVIAVIFEVSTATMIAWDSPPPATVYTGQTYTISWKNADGPFDIHLIYPSTNLIAEYISNQTSDLEWSWLVPGDLGTNVYYEFRVTDWASDYDVRSNVDIQEFPLETAAAMESAAPTSSSIVSTSTIISTRTRTFTVPTLSSSMGPAISSDNPSSPSTTSDSSDLTSDPVSTSTSIATTDQDSSITQGQGVTLTTGAIIGIAVGSIFAFCILVFFSTRCLLRRKPGIGRKVEATQPFLSRRQRERMEQKGVARLEEETEKSQVVTGVEETDADVRGPTELESGLPPMEVYELSAETGTTSFELAAGKD